MDILSTVNEIEIKDNGELTEGFLYASIKNIGSQDAQVNGVVISPGEAKTYPFVGKGYHSVNYQPSGSTLRVLEVL